jgi:hypothetical protein
MLLAAILAFAAAALVAALMRPIAARISLAPLS